MQLDSPAAAVARPRCRAAAADRRRTRTRRTTRRRCTRWRRSSSSHDPQLVAAALFGLWRAAAATAGAPAPTAGGRGPAASARRTAEAAAIGEREFRHCQALDRRREEGRGDRGRLRGGAGQGSGDGAGPDWPDRIARYFCAGRGAGRPTPRGSPSGWCGITIRKRKLTARVDRGRGSVPSGVERRDAADRRLTPTGRPAGRPVSPASGLADRLTWPC